MPQVPSSASLIRETALLNRFQFPDLLLDGTGWYSKQGIKVVVVLAKKSQSLDIFRLVKDIDPNAFISQSNVVGVYGEGFDKLKIK